MGEEDNNENAIAEVLMAPGPGEAILPITV